MDQDAIIRNLRLQLRVERAVILLVVLFLVGRWGMGGLAGRYYAIYADNKPVAVLATRESAERTLDAVKKAANPRSPSDATFKQNVTIGHISGRSELMDEKRAAESAGRALKVQLTKYAILVGGTPVVAVDTEEDAASVIEAAKERFGSAVSNLMEEPSFKQDVSVRKMTVDHAIYRPSVDEALEALVSGGGGSGAYTVADGDVASSIADRFHMKLPELQSLNGGRELDKLQIGDQLRVSMKEGSKSPRLVVVVRDQELGTEVIPYQTESVSSVELRPGKQVELNSGRNGLRRVVRAVTYENGVRTGMEVVEETLVRNAVPRRIAVGISR